MVQTLHVTVTVVSLSCYGSIAEFCFSVLGGGSVMAAVFPPKSPTWIVRRDASSNFGLFHFFPLPFLVQAGRFVLLPC